MNRRWQKAVPIVLTLASTLGLSLAGFVGVSHWHRIKVEQEFAQVSKEQTESIRKGLKQLTEVLGSVGAFFAGSQFVDRSLFQQFAQSPLMTDKGVRALAWVPKVAGYEVLAYEALAISDGLNDFRITEYDDRGRLQPIALRTEHWPVFYVEPIAHPVLRLGVDLTSDLRLHTTLGRVRETGEPAVTGRLSLPASADGAYDLYFFVPVFTRAPVMLSADSPRSVLLGIVAGAIRIDILVESSLALFSESGGGINFYLLDTSAPDPGHRMLHFHAANPERTPAGLHSNIDFESISGQHTVESFEVLGRTWQIIGIPARGYYKTIPSWEAWLTLAVGMLFSCLLTLYVSTVIRQMDKLNRLVELRTSDLSNANSALQQEVEERTHAEKKLEQEQRLFVSGKTVVVTWRAEEGWPVEYITPNVTEQFGYRTVDLINNRFKYAHIVHPDDLPYVAEQVASYARRNMAEFEQEYRIKNKEGRYCWIYDHTIVVRNALGAITHFHGYILDITRRKYSEAALAESEERYRTLVETMTEGMGAQDEHGIIQYVNGRLCEMLGYSREELVGRPVTHFIGEANIIQWAQLLSSRQRGRGDVYEIEVLHRNGSKVDLLVSPQVIRDELGQFKGGFAVFTDFSERKKSRQTLRKLSQAVEQSPNSIIITDEEGIIEYTNPCFSRTSGYSPAEAVGRSMSILQSEQTPKSVFEEMWQTIKDGQVWQGEIKNRKKDGSLYLDAVVISPIKDELGKITHFLAIQTDITERRHVEEESRLHQAELAHVGRLSTMGEMASGLAHELNQPLTAIASYGEAGLEMLRMQENKAALSKLRHVLEQSVGQAQRAGEIIRRLRRFLRKEEMVREPVQINSLVQEVMGLTQSEARHKGVVFRLELAEDLPEVCVDGIQIEQVILNLLKNGIEAIEPPGVITVRTGNYLPGAAVQVTVRDTGPGLTQEMMGQLFEAFFTTKSHGLGMGLSISRSIIESHGGRLWAEAGSGQGAVFHFTLPANGASD